MKPVALERTVMRSIRIFFAVLFFSFVSAASAQEADTLLTLLFAGDIMGHDGQINAARDDSSGTWSYDTVFHYVAPLIKGVDVASATWR